MVKNNSRINREVKKIDRGGCSTCKKFQYKYFLDYWFYVLMILAIMHLIIYFIAFALPNLQSLSFFLCVMFRRVYRRRGGNSLHCLSLQIRLKSPFFCPNPAHKYSSVYVVCVLFPRQVLISWESYPYIHSYHMVSTTNNFLTDLKI